MNARTWTLMLFVAGAGCVQVPSTKSFHAPADLKVSGACIELDDGAKPAPELFAAKFDEHMKAGRVGVANSLAWRFPDVVLQCDRDAKRQSLNAIRYASVEKELAASEADRKSGNEKAAISHWNNALTEFLEGSAATRSNFGPGQVVMNLPPPHDPILAERIAAARPEAAPWPGPAIASNIAADLAFDHVLDPALASPCKLSTEAGFWMLVGRWRLDRHEPKGALAALKKAETADTTGLARPWIQIQQAKAFMELGQSPTAVSVLTGVSGSPAVKLAALGALGACKFKDGHTEQALVLLKKAIEESPTPFPCRAEVEGDMALAYLSLGDETAGFAHLHAAQKAMEEAGRHSSLWMALENESRYLRHIGKLAEATAVEARLAADQAR